MELPAILPVSYDEGCMCPSCLKEVIIEKIKKYVKEFQKDGLENEVLLYDRNRKSFIEGIDFYIENDNTVLTEWYHLRRGNCCGNKCRHCPYNHKNVKK